jgi:hypothetical protein
MRFSSVIQDVGVFEALVEIVQDLEARMGLAGVLAPLLDDLGHELELGRMHETQVHTEAGKEKNEALGDADRLGVARRTRPADRRRLAARIAEVLDDRHNVGKRLVRVVDVALHVQHGHSTGLSHVAHVLVSRPPVALADGDPVVVTTQDLADLLGRVAVCNLGRLGLDELGVSAELCHARLEGGTGAGTREEEEHREDLVPQVGMGFAERAGAFQSEGDV